MKLNSAGLALACGLLFSNSLRAQHGHLDVGAVAQTNGAKAVWANAQNFIASSGYVKTLDPTNSGRFAGYFQNNITLTVLPATSAHGGPAENAPALGSLFHCRMSLLDGPAGGLFGFWETNSTADTGPFVSVGVGQTATNMFRLTQNDGAPTSDPFGHIHGRRFSASKAGLYKVGFQAIDVSTNGPAGGPIHAPTDVLPVWFQAGPTLPWITRTNSVTRVTFGAVGNRNNIVEYSTNLSHSSWTALRTNVGTDHFQTVSDTNSADAQRFYRLRVTLP
jgi:hypothetical protein